MSTVVRFPVGDDRPIELTSGVDRNVLLDFDGPICRVFAHHPAENVAKALKEQMRSYAPLAPAIEAFDDPHALLAVVASDPSAYAPGLAVELDQLLAEEEVTAAASAVMTEGLTPVVRSWREQGIRLGVVTNNTEAAVRVFLRAAGLLEAFDGPIIGRPGDARLMKPSGHMLRLAMNRLGTSPEGCVFVGDSWRDARAARSVGMRFVGYSRDEERKRVELSSEGVGTVISHMAELEGMKW
ncbi:HAD family hydrolase [Streptomyces sp. NPDC058864]